jgi:hypothetical protein
MLHRCEKTPNIPLGPLADRIKRTTFKITVAEILESMGLERCGGAMATSCVGGPGQETLSIPPKLMLLSKSRGEFIIFRGVA